MRLLFSPASPFSAKVRMAARDQGIALTETPVKTGDDPAELVENNPLGKIPTLLIEGGSAVFDSRAIMQVLHRRGKGSLYPADDAGHQATTVLEAQCDGTLDCLLAIIYEQRFRTAETVYQPWIDRQWSKVQRSLTQLSARELTPGPQLTAGDFALAALIGYLGLRFPGRWEADHPALLAWIAAFEASFPDYAHLRPQG